MAFKDFIFILKLRGIPTEAVVACEEFVKEEMKYNNRPTTWTQNDMGFAELADITSKEQSIIEIIDALWRTVFDFDAMGRDASKRAYKKLCANPNKHFKRIVLKSYYLHYHNISEEPKITWNNQYIQLPKTEKVEALYVMNAFKHYA